MMNVEKLLAQKQSPYKVPVKLEVVAVSPTVHYENNGNKKSCTDVAFADKTAAVKGLCYDETKVSLFKVGSQVMIRNYIYRDSCIVITAITKVSVTQGVGPLPEEVRSKAEDLLKPMPEPDVMPIAAAKKCNATMLSISGKVIRVNDVQMRTVKEQQEVPIRNIVIKDQTDEATVTLWRHHALKEIIAGTYLKITHVKTNYYKEIQFNTFQQSTITVIESPPEEELANVDGFYEEKEEIILVCNIVNTDDYLDYLCPKTVLGTFVDTQENAIEVLNGMIPFRAKVQLMPGQVSDGQKYRVVQSLSILDN